MKDPTNCNNLCQRTIRIRGIVQGVGFRPAVWRHANELDLQGYVRNDAEGVVIECRGPRQSVGQLIERLHRSPPARAKIGCIDHCDSMAEFADEGFVIADSAAATDIRTAISPDLATCPECLAEINDPGNRRYRYPFTCCIHCGPRLSIVRAVPYDRANTTMDSFPQCPACLREYHDPADRRFHAQPNACVECGPSLWLSDSVGQRLPTGDPIGMVKAALQEGKIVALKGVGGFQLAADAENPGAVAALRRRKHRPHKPFALMAPNLKVIDRYCQLSEAERILLESPEAPIVVLPRRGGDGLIGVAPGQKRLGVMLPTSPLHHLLLAGLDRPLIMTSGNPSGEPQCIDNGNALQRLADVADLFLLHDRDIVQRVDDSVVQVVDGVIQPLRRARGYAPAPLPLPQGFRGNVDILAFGGALKNTFCLVHDGQAILSPHIGDLQDAVTLADFESALALYTNIYQHKPGIVAVDQHPQYFSSRLGRQHAAERSLPLIAVQHHHAHIAACLGDNRWPLGAAPVLGVAMDGLGFADNGGDQQFWGGEVLLADYCDAMRVAHLKPVALLGADAASRQPWRNCLAQLHAALGWAEVTGRYADLPLIQALSRQPCNTLIAMADKSVNAPLSSSCGRLFDAVAAALGVTGDGDISFEGQAAMALEAVMEDSDWQFAKPYPLALSQHNDLLEIDPAPLWLALLEDLKAGCSPGIMAARFHKGLAAALVISLKRLASRHGATSIALSGGCFQNSRLQSALKNDLTTAGFAVMAHQQVPANDGGIAYGQALIAAARNQLK